MEVLPATNLDTRVSHVKAAEISEREFTMIAIVLEGHSGSELATDRARNLVMELQELAEEDVTNDPPNNPCKRRIRDVVFDCWIFCGTMDAWNWRSEDIWRTFKGFRGNKPIYELSESFRIERALKFKPCSLGACRSQAQN